MAAVVAHRAMEGRYRWLAVGGDATVWFPRGLGRLLEPLDPSLPHAISGAARSARPPARLPHPPRLSSMLTLRSVSG